MKATVYVTYDDSSIETFVEGDFWQHQFKHDLEDRNTAYIRIGDDFVNKSKIRSIKTQIEKGETK